MQRQVIIDCFPESARQYANGYAIVAIDVIRATTMAITAVASGRRCISVPSLDAMRNAAAHLENPLLAGELGGDMPAGLHMNNSPAELLLRSDIERPVVLLSSSGTRLIHEAETTAQNAGHVLLACFRNWEATAQHLLAGDFERVALIGAGSRGEFREEDQMCCAWIADVLLQAGFTPANTGTQALAAMWRGIAAQACTVSNSAKYLLRTNQQEDLDFVITHTGDLEQVYYADKSEIFAQEPLASCSLPTPSLAAAAPEVNLGIY